MKKTILPLVLLALFIAMPVQAQSVPYVIGSTRPMSTELHGYLDAWLATNPPSDAPYYIVTFFKVRANDTQVSLVGVNLSSPTEKWSFEDSDKTVWIGSVTVSTTGDVTPFTSPQSRANGGHLASLLRAAGGGSYVAFPFASGSAALYGPRGVHGSGDYGTSGMIAVDLVGGDSMGASSMPPYAYASDVGTVDYVCNDDTSVAVRTHNTSTGDYFLYAHLLDNANLEIGHTFQQGELIGSLKYGSFDPTHPNCGWADQAADHYHVHWMFVPSGGKFQVGECVLTVSSQNWQCGNDLIRVGGMLVGGGGVGAGNGNGSGATGTGGTAGGGANSVVVRDPSFWDYVLTAFFSIVDNGIVKLLPAHNSFSYTYMIFNILEIVLRLAWVLVESNINLKWIGLIIAFNIAANLVVFVVWLFVTPLRIIKNLAPAA